MLTNTSGRFRETTFRPLRGAAPHFLHALLAS